MLKSFNCQTKRAKAKKLEFASWQLANYMRPLFEVLYIFTAEVISYQEQWNWVTTIDS